MTAFLPAYRLTVYAPRSQDATEATVLRPIAGAAHSDPFVVTSVQGVGGAKPYLGIPTGRHGEIDPVSKKTTVGSLTVKLFDVRTTVGGSNANRWVTAFLGNTTGQQQLVGLKAKLEESLDAGVTWADYFTGRVYNPNLAGAQWISLEIRGAEDDFKRKVFVGAPALAVSSYAFLPSLMPIGLPQAWANFPAVGQIHGTIANRLTFTNAEGRVVERADITFDSTTINPWFTLIVANIDGMAAHRLVMTAAGRTGVYRAFLNPSQAVYNAFSVDGVMHYTCTSLLAVETIKPADPSYASMPGNGTAVTCYVTPSGPTAFAPLMVNDVHPIQFWADLTDGYFSALDENGRARAIAPRDTSPSGPWAKLLADPSLRKQRFQFEAALPYNEVIEKYICQPYNLAYRVDGSGRIVPLDLRRSAHVVPAGTLTDDDLVASDEPGWGARRDDAITGIEFFYYVDQRILIDDVKKSRETYPNVSPFLINSIKNSFFLPNDLSTVRDIGEKVISIDGRGFRVNIGGTEAELAKAADELSLGLQVKAENLRHYLEGALYDMMAPFAGGAIRIPLRCRRSAIASAIYPGMWQRLQVSKVPDPGSNTRGGGRLALCLGRSENGAGIDFLFMDAGANAIAVAPTITALTIPGDNPNAVDVSVTHNTNTDDVVVHYALTPTTTAVRPDELAFIWTFGGVTPGPLLRVTPLPSGVRVWIRARSQSRGDGLTLPSVWAYPTGNGYVDLAGLAAPTAAAVTNTFANRTDLTWTVGAATTRVEIFLVAGVAPAAWFDSNMIQSLEPGSAKTRVFGLAAGTQYTLGVRHRESSGGASSFSTVTFVSGGAPGTAPRPAGLDIAVRPSA